MTRFRTAAALALALAAVVPLGAASAAPDTAPTRTDRRAGRAITPLNARIDAPAAISAIYGAGYSAVSELDWERGGWEAKAVDSAGRHVKLYIDPASGAITARDRGRRSRAAGLPASVTFDAPAAIAAVYRAGYTALSELEWERGGWQVKAHDAAGQRVRLRVDPATGAVTPRTR